MYIYSFPSLRLMERAVLLLLLSLASSVRGECLTVGGESCVFPFTYQEVTYNGCTDVSDPEGKLWCATKVDQDGNYILFSEAYGHCRPSCPVHQNELPTEFGLRSSSEEETCPEKEECLAQGECEEFQNKKRKLRTISDKSSQEYSSILKGLRDKVCNPVSQKVCCSCPCRTRDQCPPVEELYRLEDIPRLKSLVCSFKERTFYCCDNTPGETAPAPVSVISEDPTFSPSWLPDPEKQACGFNESPPSRVKGGEDTKPGEYPYTALIGSHDKSNQIQWKCGGTLINHWYVLTAAHCHGTNTKRITRVRLGEWSVKDKEDCWKSGRRGGNWCLEPVQDFIIGPDQVTVHENYQPVGQFLNDIALVKLDRPAQLKKGVSFACLPSDAVLAAEQLNVRDLSTDSGLAGKYGIVVGWGYTDYDPFKGGVQGDLKKLGVANNILQKLEVPVIPAEECYRMFRQKLRPADTQICAGGERDKDSCKGDSGGPLYFKTIAGTGDRPSEDNITPTYVLGIVSFGSRNCGSGTPGIYTNVREYMPWIKKIIRRN